jgi:hypothetical protein
VIFCAMGGVCPVCGANGRNLEPHAATCPPGDPSTIEAGLCGWEATVVVSPPWGGSLNVCAAHAEAIRDGRDLG